MGKKKDYDTSVLNLLNFDFVVCTFGATVHFCVSCKIFMWQKYLVNPVFCVTVRSKVYQLGESC